MNRSNPNARERLPLEPLLAAIQARGIELGRSHRLAEKALSRAKSEGGQITYTAADRICINVLGEHPAAIYGEDWWVAA